METLPNFPLWLAWALFGTVLSLLVWRVYLPLALRAPAPSGRRPPPAWLYCEDGAALDRRVRWFALRPGGCTVLGRVPRRSEPETEYLYLNAHDIEEEHARIAFDPKSGRYVIEALRGGVRHNNEPLLPGSRASLSDGDTLDLGAISRFRFTLTGPEGT